MEKTFLNFIETINFKSKELFYNKLINFYYQHDKISSFIFDFEQGKCLYISPSVKDITGYENVQYINQGIMFYLKNVIHPEDNPCFISSLNMFIRTSEGINSNCINSFSFRIKHKKGLWVRVNLKSLKICKYSNKITDVLIGFISLIIDYNTEVRNYNNVSYREKEILQLLAGGLSSKMIADKLNISETTVITHRKSLRNKLDVKNTAELIKKAYKTEIL